MPRYDVFLEGRAESSTCYFGVAVMADDQKEAEYLGHEAGRKKHRECDEIEVVGVMPVISARNAGARSWNTSWRNTVRIMSPRSSPSAPWPPGAPSGTLAGR